MTPAVSIEDILPVASKPTAAFRAGPSLLFFIKSKEPQMAGDVRGVGKANWSETHTNPGGPGWCQWIHHMPKFTPQTTLICRKQAGILNVAHH